MNLHAKNWENRFSFKIYANELFLQKNLKKLKADYFVSTFLGLGYAIKLLKFHSSVFIGCWIECLLFLLVKHYETLSTHH
jgi:hypothetical protein